VKLFYRYLIHIIRSAHGLNTAAKIIHGKLTLLNNLISSIKDVCEGKIPDVSVSRTHPNQWRAWTAAALLYYNHSDDVKPFTDGLDSSDDVN
jgi:hypothetical protein